jgi:glycosyltransferase involved in cell wall biosynthesis
MLDSPNDMPKPLVSIILPTYNRAAFLPEAFASICAQTWLDWELIIIDDGSTDNTEALTKKFQATIPQRVVYRRYSNQGAYAARNLGLDHASGNYIAFFDSDDVWLPHHLRDCVEALETHAEVDWVYGAAQLIDYTTRRVLTENCFILKGKPRPFMNLHRRQVGSLFLIDDPEAVRCQMLYGLYCGLQVSVLRRRIFNQLRFVAHYRNECEDQVFVIRALKAGFRLGYFDNIHLHYYVHEGNSSLAAKTVELEKRINTVRWLIRGYQELTDQVTLTPTEAQALARRLGRDYFWSLGYNVYWQYGYPQEALAMFRQGLHYWPREWRTWKTYLTSLLKVKLGLMRTPLHPCTSST